MRRWIRSHSPSPSSWVVTWALLFPLGLPGLTLGAPDHLIPGPSSDDPVIAADLTRDELDAIALLQGNTSDGHISARLLAERVAELALIRLSEPKLQNIHQHQAIYQRFNQIEIYFHELPPQLEKVGKFPVPPTDTGYPEIDALNREYGAAEAVFERDDPRQATYANLTLRFTSPLDITFILSRYRSVSVAKKVFSEMSGVVGDGHQIRRSEFDGEIGYYFSIGSGDCAAGCTSRDPYWFRIVRGKVGKATSDREGIPPFGFPFSRGIAPFDGADDALAMIRYPVWWYRLAAVDALGESLLVRPLDEPGSSSVPLRSRLFSDEILARLESVLHALRERQEDERENPRVRALAQDYLKKFELIRKACK